MRTYPVADSAAGENLRHISMRANIAMTERPVALQAEIQGWFFQKDGNRILASQASRYYKQRPFVEEDSLACAKPAIEGWAGAWIST